MSSKKDKFYLNLALNLAKNMEDLTGTNPSVGSVLVKNDEVISLASTGYNGTPHSEFNLLNKVDKKITKGSSLYVTLEPCSHYGKTPPCVDLIKSKKIRKTYYCFDDPDLRTYKKAKKRLKEKIIKINSSSKNLNFYKGYYLNKKKKMPLVDAKIACSKDNFTINRKSKWITNLRSRKTAHLIRSKYGGMSLMGSQTQTSMNIE